jgi:uncharacterized protein GlcG (DUF336 family)
VLGLGNFRKFVQQGLGWQDFELQGDTPMTNQTRCGILITILALSATLPARAQAGHSKDADAAAACKLLPPQSQLKAALKTARSEANGGFNLDMWGTVVNRDGVVCAVAFTGADRGSQWPGSRVISAQKANTANAFSLPKLALSTADLFSAVQPGGSLFGLQASNPVDASVAYRGEPADYGTPKDPMVGGHIGGVNVFGGGLALYNEQGVLVGAIGVSGDSSCADHNIAWRTRNALKLDHVPGGVGPDKTRPDNIVYDITAAPGLALGVSASGWGHPACSADATKIAGQLPPIP